MEENTTSRVEEIMEEILSELKKLNQNIEAMNAKKTESRDFKPRSFGGGDRKFGGGDRKFGGDKKFGGGDRKEGGFGRKRFPKGEKATSFKAYPDRRSRF